MSVTVYEPTGIVHSVIAHLGDIRTMTSVVHLTQYDNTLPTIAVKLMNGAQTYKIAESATVSIRVGKPDKTGVYNPCLGVSSDYTTAYFAATEQMCAADGKAFAVVEIIDGGTASTGVFVIDIAENPVNDETILSDSELGIIQTLVDEAKNAAQTAADEAAQAAAELVKPEIETIVTEQIAPVNEAVTELQRSKADAIVETASGESLHVEDASGNGLHNLKVFGKATQDGTPTPEAPVDIAVAGSGGSIEINFNGENFIKPLGKFPYINSGVTISQNEDGSFHLFGTATIDGNVRVIDPSYGKYNLNLSEATLSITANGEYDGNFVIADAYETAWKYIMNAKIGKSTTGKVVSKKIGAFLTVTSGVSYDVDIYPMLNYGDSALPFEPYNGNTFTVSTPNGLPGIPVSSGGNYTDETGQQYISDYVDCEACKTYNLIKKYYGVKVRAKIESAQYGDYFTADVRNLKKSNQSKDEPAYVLSIKFKAINFYYRVAYTDTYRCYVSENGDLVIRVPIGVSLTTDEMNEILSDTIFYCVLETPEETDLTAEEISAYKALHTNKTVTNVFSDSNVGIEMDYGADTKTYVDNLKSDIQELKAAVLLLQGGN